jgi:hypothetical protein
MMSVGGMEERQKYWWIKDLLDQEVKVMGAYLALLYLRIGVREKFVQKPLSDKILNDLRATKLYAHYFSDRGDEGRQAFEAGKIFIDRLFKNEEVLDLYKRDQVLDEIEHEFHNHFVKAFVKYLRFERIPRELKEKIVNALLDIRSGLYGGTQTYTKTTIVNEEIAKERLKNLYGLKEDEAKRLFTYLISSGLAIDWSWALVFPAPCLSDEIIKTIEQLKLPSPSSQSTTSLQYFSSPSASDMTTSSQPSTSPPSPPLSWEDLEEMTAKVFRDLGFNVNKNAKREARRGMREVDVWAWKDVAGARFSVYVSCKNWDKAIEKDVVDEEIGRILSLRELPQLKVIIAKQLTSPAKEAAEVSGFLVIELGEKAEAGDKEGVYKLIYEALTGIFTPTALSKFKEMAFKIAERVAEAKEGLKKIDDVLKEMEEVLKPSS